MVVDGDGFPNHLSGLLNIAGTMKQELCFQNTVNTLRQGILVAVITIRHRATDTITLMQTLITRGTILHTPVRVMHQGECCFSLL